MIVLQIKAREFAVEGGISRSQASRGWAQNFMKSADFPLRMQDPSFKECCILNSLDGTENRYSVTTARNALIYQMMMAGDCCKCNMHS